MGKLIKIFFFSFLFYKRKKNKIFFPRGLDGNKINLTTIKGMLTINYQISKEGYSSLFKKESKNELFYRGLI